VVLVGTDGRGCMDGVYRVGEAQVVSITIEQHDRGESEVREVVG